MVSKYVSVRLTGSEARSHRTISCIMQASFFLVGVGELVPRIELRHLCAALNNCQWSGKF
jgi:hypothetical protein